VFISRKGRPFDAFLKREEGRIAWEFPPRTPKLDKDGNPIATKGQGPAGPVESRQRSGRAKRCWQGEILQTGDGLLCPQAGRQPAGGRFVHDQAPPLPRRRFLLRKSASCSAPLRPNQPHRGLPSPSGITPFKAFLVLAKNKAKAQFEFPPGSGPGDWLTLFPREPRLVGQR